MDKLSFAGKLFMAGLGIYAFSKYLERKEIELKYDFYDVETILPQLTAKHVEFLNAYAKEHGCSFLDACQALCDFWNKER